MTQQRITLSPANPVPGQVVTICYDFQGSTITTTRLDVSFSPGNTVTQYTVTETSPCVDVMVPANATTILVHDVDGDSPDKGAVIDS